jgi:hypothetical protein
VARRRKASRAFLKYDPKNPSSRTPTAPRTPIPRSSHANVTLGVADLAFARPASLENRILRPCETKPNVGGSPSFRVWRVVLI